MIREVKLGEICNILNGYAFKSKEYVEDGIRIIRITNVQKGIIQDTDPKYYKIDKIETLKNYMLKENDLLISLTGNVGRVGQISKDLLPAGLNQRVGCIRIKEEKDVSIDYLYQYFNSYNFERDCINNSKGIAQKNLSTEWLKNYKMKIPNLNEQNRIVNELKKIQRLKKLKEQQLKELNQLIKSQFVEMFGDIKIKEKMKNVSVYFSRGKTPNYVEKSNIKVISQACIYWDKFKYEKAKYQDENKALKSLEKMIENGDVLITSTGTGTLGRCNVYYGEEHKYMADSHVSILRLNYKEVNPIFFKYYFMQEKVQKELYAECVNGSTNQIELSKDRFLNFRILMPEITLQNQFSEIVKQIDKQKFESMIQLKMMEKIYNIINDRRRYV
jgi:putative type I restriction-modification system, S subunit